MSPGSHISRHESVSSLNDGVFLDAVSVTSDVSNASDTMSNISETDNDIDEDAKVLEERTSQLQMISVTHCNKWKTSINIVEKEMLNPTINQEDCKLQYLNISHNSFREVPACLPCLAPHLGRLIMSYNSLTSVGPLSRYPSSLKQLDLSHNQISSWPSEKDSDCVCYNVVKEDKISMSPACSTPEPRKIGRSLAARQNSRIFCSHRRHVKLEQLRSLILANNNLREIWIHINVSDSSSSTISEETIDQDPSQIKSKLMYPNLSKLDVSNNSIKVVPTFISELTNLSTFHIAGNEHVTDLPPEMGLCSRLWNLTTK